MLVEYAYGLITVIVYLLIHTHLGSSSNVGIVLIA